MQPGKPHHATVQPVGHTRHEPLVNHHRRDSRPDRHCVYSPPIDQQGNSVRGIRVCQEISNEFELHAFNNRTNVRSVIRRDYPADLVRSNRLRTPEERKHAGGEGGKIAVLEAQGALFFGSTEQLLRRLAQLAAEARYVVVDFKRVHLADTSARKLIVRAARAMADGETELLFARCRR